jgi:uncharacterized membrane protein
MLDWIHDVIRAVAVALEIAAVSTILVGWALAFYWFLVHAWEGRDALDRFPRAAYDSFRVDLGRAMLVGLELLVAAEIVHTAAAQTFRSLGLVAGIIAIRTALAFVLTIEIERRWPWQREQAPRPVAEVTSTGRKAA